MTSFISKNAIFLTPVKAQAVYENEFNLSAEDVRLIQYFFTKINYKNNFSALPKNLPSRNLNLYFDILRNQNHKKWITAYLFLLSILPELFEEDIGC